MERHFVEHLRPLRWGLVFAMLSVLYGFGLGGVFGIFEDQIKDHLQTTGEQVLVSVYQGDESQLNAVTKKSWIYFKRAHLHANGIGTTALVCIVLLSFLATPVSAKRVVSMALGIGALGYSSFWMWAALRAPAMGGTGAAKASLEWLAVPSAGLCLFGVVFVLVNLVYHGMLQHGGEA